MRRYFIFALCLLFTAMSSVLAQTVTTNPNFFEKLNRGLVVSPHSSGRAHIVSWRLLGTDDANTTFDIVVNGVTKQKNISKATNVMLSGLKVTDQIQLLTYQNGELTETSEAVNPWSNFCKQIPTDLPAGGVNPANETYTYSPNDCSVGDVDGDGEYEIFLKWDPSNSKDNSQGGYTGNVYIDCIKLDGTKLWRIDLGKNIRAGAHYTQFMVWDFDGDGKAELICKTGPGTIDGTGTFVSQAATNAQIKSVDDSKDWRNSGGRIDGGQEWLTVFNGQTGKAIHTIPYLPNRNAALTLSESNGTFNWDDRSGKNDYSSYGNRGERYLATVAYLDGPDQNACAVMCRGYYTYAHLWAVSFDGQELHNKWLHEAKSKTQYNVYSGETLSSKQTYTAPKNTANVSTSNTAYGNGNHNISCADVDGDGCDEIVWGSCAIDHDGKLLYATGLGHGDAIHLSDLIPSRPGLELFQIHEEGGNVGYGYDLHDAATGEIIYRATGSGDNGRGMAADVLNSNECFEFWSAAAREARSAETGNIMNSSVKPSMNFRIYWDGKPNDDLLDGTTISDPEGFSQKISNNNSSTCNSTKSTPCLSADILGDWREEVILWDTQTKNLNLFITRETSDVRVPTLMHDHVYRLGVAWQNVAYNQPPHLGYYLPWYLEGKEPPSTGIDVIKGAGQWAQLRHTRFTDALTIDLDILTGMDFTMSLYTPSGALVAQSRFYTNGDIPATLRNLDRLPQGVYLLRLDCKLGSFTRRVIK